MTKQFLFFSLTNNSNIMITIILLAILTLALAGLIAYLTALLIFFHKIEISIKRIHISLALGIIVVLMYYSITGLIDVLMIY